MNSMIAIGSFLSSHLRGKAALWSAFWLILVVGGALVSFVVSFALWAAVQPSTPRWSQFAYFVSVAAITLVHLFFSFVSLWRCAPNVSWHPFGVAARVLVVGGVILVLWSARRPPILSSTSV